MNRTEIEWTDYSSNPIRAINTETGKAGHFCVHASPGCKTPGGGKCYAEAINLRFGNGLHFIAQNRSRVRFEVKDEELRQWQRHRGGGKVFVCDMTDLWQQDLTDAQIERVFAGAYLAPHLTFQFLTKRAKRLREWATWPDTPSRIAIQVFELLRAWDVPEAEWPQWAPGLYAPDGHATVPVPWPLPNVWLGVSVEDQKRADERIPDLLKTPAAVRFLSVEPLLGPVDLVRYLGGGYVHVTEAGVVPMNVPLKRLHWCIVGGQSGPGAVPMHPDWVRHLRDQCEAAGVAYFFKQWGEYVTYQRPEVPSQGCDYLWVSKVTGRTLADCPQPRTLAVDAEWAWMGRVGKKRAGRLLDGRTWDELPTGAGAGG